MWSFPWWGVGRKVYFVGLLLYAITMLQSNPRIITTSSGTGIVRLIFQIRKQTQRT